MTEDSRSLTVWVRVDSPAASGARGIAGTLARADERRVALQVDRLKEQLESLVSTVGEMLRDVTATPQGFILDEVTLSAEITAEGGFSILGFTEAKAGGKGGLELTFRRGR